MADVAIYAGSFDPFTYGHYLVFEGAQKLAKKVIVAIGKNVSKKGLFSVEERIEIVKDSLRGLIDDHTVYDVRAFDGLLVDFCKRVEQELDPGGVVIIARGLRALSDLESELAIADINRRLAPGFQTVFIPTTAEAAFISSSAVREIALHTQDPDKLSHYVAPSVKQRLIDKLRK